jgi:hypothetical protein
MKVLSEPGNETLEANALTLGESGLSVPSGAESYSQIAHEALTPFRCKEQNPQEANSEPHAE